MATQTQLTPEILVPRLGEYLIRRKLITESGLQKALLYQQEQVANGQACLLGEALIELKVVERSALDQAITELILQLRNALQDANRNLEKRVQERTAELQEALERLSELSQLKANFVSNISHELRTPLTHIKGYLELMLSESLGPTTEEQTHALQVSQRSAARLENLIEDLILFSLTSRGELSVQMDLVDIQMLANQVVKTAMPKGAERGVTVHAVLDDSLPNVHGDVQKLSWVLNQLLDNAIKFTPEGGRVVLKVKLEGTKLVMVSVLDTGIGMPSERIQEIFEPFHQLDGSSTRRYGGTGLGLSLVRQIIEAHGSVIEVESTQGRGSVFRFPLLVAGAEA